MGIAGSLQMAWYSFVEQDRCDRGAVGNGNVRHGGREGAGDRIGEGAALRVKERSPSLSERTCLTGVEGFGPVVEGCVDGWEGVGKAR